MQGMNKSWTACRRRLLAVAVLAAVAAPVAMAQTQTQTQAPRNLVDLVKRTKPSVLAIGLYNATSSPRLTFRGTGFVVGDGNQVVTNAHVLPDPDDKTFGNQIRVRVVAGSSAPDERIATVEKVDRARDVAVLRIEGAPLPTLPLTGRELAEEGTAVAYLGFPIGGQLGMIPVTHRGLLSSVANVVMPTPTARQLTERAVLQLREGGFAIYQLDGTAYPGNSGGPLLDAETGRVIGVISMVLAKGSRETTLTHPSGISYAVPVRHVIDLLEAR
jgi:serine protease Do